MNCKQTQGIQINSLKRHSTYTYKYDYIQAFGILKSLDLQR